MLHPFGRHCLGYKSAGERDVWEAIEQVKSEYKIDPRRIVLMGFSMGGAGAWHLGAHYADQFAAVSPGAGFAETAEYNRLEPSRYPADYEQALWGLYDVPAYARNLLNVPLVAYSGENDKQIQAARVMERALAEHGHPLTHLIGPGMGHQYHPDTLAEIMRRMDQFVRHASHDEPRTVHLQTRTLRYPQMHWVRAEGLERHWRDARVDAEVVTPHRLVIATQNIRRFQLTPSVPFTEGVVEIDGQEITVDQRIHPAPWQFVKRETVWQEMTAQPAGPLAEPVIRAAGPVPVTDSGNPPPAADVVPSAENAELRKKPGQQGPLDDLFVERFLVVTPTGVSRQSDIDAWVQFELDHLRRRWRYLFRGTLPEKPDIDVTDGDIASRHLVLWGTPESNRLLLRVMQVGSESTTPAVSSRTASAGETSAATRWPLRWTADQLVMGRQQFAHAHRVPLMIYPNPLNPDRYVVLNSGPTFREAHDRTNSLQNPKLPDWAVLDIRVPPNAEQAGAVVAAAFFDEQWQPRPEP